MTVSFSSEALAAKPAKATLVSPMGTIYEDTPTYTWNAVSDSTSYYLWVDDSTGTPIKTWYTAADAGCGSGSSLCSITPNTALALGSCEWWIQTRNNDGYGDWSASLEFTVEEGFNEASIQGTYAFTGMEQGGAPAPSSGPVVQEAAMGIISADGNGSIIGKITWNQYDFLDLDQDPDTDRLVLHRFPLTGTYNLEGDGFGTFTSLIDQNLDGVVDMELPGKLVVTKSKNLLALEFFVIGDNPVGSGTIAIMHCFKREQ
jgi:hypothetical protein